ncbi:hypothetical protein EOI86_22230 [Hwanghaeella grinnelliae]|uniref:GSCFA domain-containing protein n=1 Tax=Hwanghaeella grinnelliae TaxID=2500179 RepID=A0A3S2W238_9PROT|nr:GSCFA domain-containing protein [Hwanghaeella grinnelliae]RVU33854.1 hypothetical protein EOI86_22230 [Hwanghaeella grinnelliae]
MAAGPAVFSDQQGLLDDGALAFLLRSIFSDRAFQAYLFQQISTAPNRVRTYDELLEVLNGFFQQTIPAAEGEDRDRLLAHAAEYQRHCAETEVARNAYSGEGKANPMGVFWPNPTRKDGRSLKQVTPVGERFPLVDRTTAIGSAGSCFAYEIARNLQRRGFNYVVTEPEHDGSKGAIVDGYDPDNPYARFSATWGLIFNTPSLRQLAERAFGEAGPSPVLIEERFPDGGMIYTDPYREGVAFAGPDAFTADSPNHLDAVRRAFTETEVFIVTLGLNECWELKADGTVLSNNPRRGWMYALSRPRTLTVAENVEEVERFLSLVRKHNPNFKVILSLSPIPLIATHRPDQHVVSANAHSKAVLRVAAEEIVARNDGVYYFPSYEYVMHCAEDAWCPDERHVTDETVGKIMEMFDDMFMKDGGAAPDA